MARLEHSLTILRQTQETLKEAIDSDDGPADPDLTEALDENEDVMQVFHVEVFFFCQNPHALKSSKSQTERIHILGLALEARGLRREHYTTTSPPNSRPTQPAVLNGQDGLNEDEANANQVDGGLHL